jgi:hypothetical protein
MESEEIHVRVRGKRQCHAKPEYKTERVSSIVASHSAHEGLLCQIMGHPGCRYHVSYTALLFHPRTISEMGNEVADFGDGSHPVNLNAKGVRTQRTTTYVAGKARRFKRSVDGVEFEETVAGVDWVIAFKLNYPEPQYLKMLWARLRNGNYYGDQPYLGMRELVASVELVSDFSKMEYPVDTEGWVTHPNGLKTVDYSSELGLSFYGTDWEDPKHPNYFAYLKVEHGIVRYPTWAEVRALGIKRENGK